MKKLEVMIRGNDAVVFVKPAKMPCVRGDSKAMDFDWTLSTLADSVSFTYTLLGESSMPVDSVRFVWSEPRQTVLLRPAEKVFEEPKGDKWIYRRRVLLSKEEFERLAASPVSPEVEVGRVAFRIKPSEWKDRSIIYKTAIEIINRNK